MSTWDAGCLGLLFLALTSLMATLALRSAWKHRHEAPLTPLRFALTLLMIGAALLPLVLRASPDRLLIIATGVFLVSTGWLAARGL